MPMKLPLVVQLQAAGLPPPNVEYEFAPGRRYRLDYTWPSRMIACEVDGAVYTQGRHTRGKGYTEDCRKLNLAVELGWRVYRFTTEMVENGEALAVLERVLGGNP
jgi:very-short-patch-repair endonuclease